MSDRSQIELYKRKWERERQARKQAEALLEEKSRQLYHTNQTLDKLNRALKQKVEDTALELEIQQNRYYSFIDQAEDIIYSSGESGHVKSVNPVASKMLGFTTEEIIGEHFLSFVQPNYRDQVSAFYYDQLKNQIPSTYYEFPVLTKDNRILWMGQRLILVKTNEGDIEFLGIVRDISERRAKEKELELLSNNLRQKADFLSAINKFAESVMDKHSITEVAWEVTQNLMRILGFEDCIIYLKDNTGQNLLQIAALGDKATEEQQIKDPIIIPWGQGITGHVAKTGIGEIIADTTEDPRYIVDDQIRYSELTVPIISDGEVIGVIDSEHSQKNFFTTEHFDFVTTVAGLIANKVKNTILLEDQRKAERVVAQAAEKIAKSEEKYRRIIQNMNLGLLEVDRDGYIVDPSPIFCAMTGYDRGELIAKRANDIFLESGFQPTMQDKDADRKRGKSDVYEVEMLRKDGEKFWVLISGAPVYGDEKEVVGSIGIHLDISDQKKLQAALNVAKLEAEKARDFEKEFLANMSHEIRNPLHSVVGMTNLLYDTDLSIEQKEYLDNIKYSADLLLALVSDILDMNKIAEGKMEKSIKTFQLKETYNGLRSTIQFRLEDSDISFNGSYDESIPSHVKSDPTYVNQILFNLLGNASKFTTEGSIDFDVKLVKREKDQVVVAFHIHDTGIGIPKSKLETIFDRFSQAGKVDEKKSQGTGLGLFITQKLTELLGGDIQMTSEEGVGTQFVVTLPFEVASNEMVHHTSHPQDPAFANLRVLIVEDNDINRTFIIKILEKNGISCASAKNGQLAIELLEQEPFDLILMDIRMPVMDGYQTTLWLRSQQTNQNKDIPVIALTASALLDEKEKALNAGMNHHITKPFTPETLLDAIQEFTGQHTILLEDEDSLSLPEELDARDIIELYGGDWDHALMVFEIFLKNIEEELSDLRSRTLKMNRESIRQLLHKIKPNFRMVGLRQLESEAIALEDMCRDETVTGSDLASEIQEFINKVLHYLPVIREGCQRIAHTVKT